MIAAEVEGDCPLRGHWSKVFVTIVVGLIVGAAVAAALMAVGVLPPIVDSQTISTTSSTAGDPPISARVTSRRPNDEEPPEALLQPLVPRDPEGALGFEPMARPAVRRPTIDADCGMRVVALCDPGFRRHHEDWRTVASERIRGAADILWDELQLDLVEAAPAEEWEPRAPASSIVDLLNGLGHEVAEVMEQTGARFVLGMVLQDHPQPQNLCGLSRVLTDHCVVLETPASPMPEVFHHVTIAHEIAHCFGAFHSPEPDSIMVPKLVGEIPTRLDDANRQVLQLTRGANLSEGERALSEGTLVEMAEITRNSMVPGEHNGAADQIARRAYRALKRNDFDEGERLCRLALRYAPNLWDTHANLAYALLRQGEPEEARSALRAALEGDPSLWEQSNIRELNDALVLRDIPHARP